MLTSRWSVTPLLWSASEKPFRGTSVISILITISLKRNESGSRLTNGGETERNRLLFDYLYHIQNMIKAVRLCFHNKRRPVNAHLPINVNIQENMFLVEIWNFLGKKKKDDPGSDEARHCLVSISSPEMWVNSQRKWHWNCINFSGFGSGATTVQTRISGRFWMVTRPVPEDQFSRWWIRSTVSSSRNNKMPNDSEVWLVVF